MRPEVKERFLATGMEVIARSPAAFGDAVKADMAVVAKAVKNAGLKPD